MRKTYNKYSKSSTTTSGATNAKLRAKVREFDRKAKGKRLSTAEQRLVTQVKDIAYSGGVVRKKDMYMSFVRLCNKL